MQGDDLSLSNMELIIKDIKERLRNCSPDELEKQTTIWRNQFRQQGISIIALETLLNFYSKPHSLISNQSDDEFITLYTATHSSDSDEDYQFVRSELDKLRTEKKKYQRQNKSLRKYCIALSLLCMTFLVTMLFLFIFYNNVRKG